MPAPLRGFGVVAERVEAPPLAVGGPFAPFESKSGTLPVSSAYAGVEFQPTSNLSLSLGVGVVQQSGRIDSEINALPGASSFSVGGRRY